MGSGAAGDSSASSKSSSNSSSYTVLFAVSLRFGVGFASAFTSGATSALASTLTDLDCTDGESEAPDLLSSFAGAVSFTDSVFELDFFTTLGFLSLISGAGLKPPLGSL